MDERYENDYENTANQWEETDEGGRVTYRERSPRSASGQPRQAARRTVEFEDENRAPQSTYEPTGAREYRADSRPGRPRTARRTDRQAAAAPAGGGAAEAVANYGQFILLALVALLAVISIITGVVSCASGGGNDQAQSSSDIIVADTQAAANVEAAEKTTDSNGIVHGTTEDGTNFTIVQAGDATAASAATSESTSEGTDNAADDQNAEASSSAATTTQQKVSFAAVGDQVASDFALELADGYAGEAGDGKYDFKPFYQEVKPFLQQSNLRYINQETPLIGGQENYEVSGYPNFISPEACAEAIADTGFNMVNFTSNHSYDAGTEGIEYSQKVWEKYPQIVIGGSYTSQQERETVHMIESNGIRFAFLAYSYGDNSYTDVTKEPNNYYAVPFVKDDAAADIARAKKVADCIIVSMHWGEEYTAELNNDQKDWAQWLADQDVDLVIGTHAHNIQPVQYFTGSGGNKIPVVFGLGDFVSGWTITDTILSGIFTCDFVRQDTGRVSVENPKWHPTIEWSDGSGQTYVRMLENMSVDQINANTRTEDVPNSFSHVYNTTNSVISQIPVEWGADADDKAAKAGSGDEESEGSSSSAASADADADDDEDSDESSSTSGHVDEDEDGYDDNTDEWIGFGDDEDADADTDADTDADADASDEDADYSGDDYDDNTDEWIGGDEDYSDDEATDEGYDETSDEEEEE